MRRFIHRHQTDACLPCWVKAGLGAMLALGVMALVGEWSGVAMIAAPLGASAVLVFGLPESPMSQPANVIAGHVLATLVGLAFAHVLPQAWWSLAAAVGLVMVMMGALRILHPPAGADPLVVMWLCPDWTFVIFPVLAGAVLLVAMAMLVHRLPPGRTTYPLPPPGAGEKG